MAHRITQIFFLVVFIIFIFLITKTRQETISQLSEPPLNITLWGKTIQCKKFHAVINITDGEDDKYYLKEIRLIVPGVELENKKKVDIPANVNDSIEIEYEVTNMDRLPCNSMLEFIFFDYLNRTYFSYVITGC